jgi:hypothetical protein
MNNIDAVDCPVENCPANYTKRGTMWLHFNYRLWKDIIIIDEEGRLPQCMNCFFFCTTANKPKHINSDFCRDGVLRHIRRQQQYLNELAQQTTIQIADTDLQNVDTFKYLGRPLSATGNDMVAIKYNLSQARKTWGRMSTILKREGADTKTMANFYKAVVQASLLYGSDTWHIPNNALIPLQAFHNKVARYISHQHIRKIPNTEIWVYPDMNRVLNDLNLLPISQYIEKRKQTLLKWAQDRPIYQQARFIENNSNRENRFWGPTPNAINEQD